MHYEFKLATGIKWTMNIMSWCPSYLQACRSQQIQFEENSPQSWTFLEPPQTLNNSTISAQFQCESKSKHPFNGGLEGLRQLTHLLLGGHTRSSPSFLPASSLLSQQPLFLRFLPNFFAAAPSFSAFPPNHPAFSGRRCWHASSLQNHQSCQQSDYPAAVRQCGKFAQELVPMHWMKNS